MPVPVTPDPIGDDAEDHDDHPRQDHGMGDVLGRRCTAQGVQRDVENEPDAQDDETSAGQVREGGPGF
jgi:hypothetical protein